MTSFSIFRCVLVWVHNTILTTMLEGNSDYTSYLVGREVNNTKFY